MVPPAAVADATVLIYLGKLDRLDWLQERMGSIVIPKAVHREVVVEGKARKEPDAVRAERAIEAGWVVVEEAKPDPRVADLGFDGGDLEVLSLALARGDERILADEAALRDAARAFGIRPRGTLSILAWAVDAGRLDLESYLAEMERLVGFGFRMSHEVYARAVRLGRDLADG